MASESEQALQAATTAPVAVSAPLRNRRVFPPPGIGSKAVAYLVVWVISFISLFPIYWMIENSLRTSAAADSGVSLLPETLQWSNYATMWNYFSYGMHVFLINSFLVAGLVTLG